MIFKLKIERDCEEEIVATVHKRTPLIDNIEQMVLQSNVVNKIPCYYNDEIVLLDVQTVECFVSECDKIYAFSNNKNKYLVKKRLYELEEILPKQFERISKSAIANFDQISKFKVELSGAVDIVFKSGYTEGVSRRCFSSLRRRYSL